MQTLEQTQTLTETAPQHGWATIAEVSEALGVQYNTIKQAVLKARTLQQDWVKLMPHPAPGYPLRWLLDTNHAIYQHHEKRWRKLAQKSSTKQTSTSSDTAARGEVSGKAPAISSYSTSEAKVQGIDVTGTWPELCHWLAEQGLVVFVNAIAPDQGWQWSWGDNAGAGYADATAAITAALQYQLMFGVPYLPAYPSSAYTAPSTQAERSF
jgi:hypothetical protein